MNQGKFNRIVRMFMKAKDKNNHLLNMDYLLIKKQRQRYLHHFNDDHLPSDVRSISE